MFSFMCCYVEVIDDLHVEKLLEGLVEITLF